MVNLLFILTLSKQHQNIEKLMKESNYWKAFERLNIMIEKSPNIDSIFLRAKCEYIMMMPLECISDSTYIIMNSKKNNMEYSD